MKNILVISTGLVVDHANRLITGIRNCAAEKGANLFIFTCARKYEKNVEHDMGEYNIYNLADYGQFDGAILLNSTVGSEAVLEEIASKIEDAGIPAVGIERDDHNMFGYYIDNKAAMREIVEHFVNFHGYKRINYISGPLSNEEACDRLNAYRAVLISNNIPIDVERIYYDGTFLKESGVLAVEKFLQSDLPLPQAIVCANDLMALGAYDALISHGLRVPEDVAISGFDDDFDTKYHIPSITSVAREQEKMGYMACEKLFAGIRIEEKGQHIAVPTKVKYRESCGCSKVVEVDDVAFRKRHYEERRNTEKMMEIIKNMSIDLNGVENLEDLKQQMKVYLKKVECKEIYLFLCDDFADINDKMDIYQEAEIDHYYLRYGYGDHSYLFLGYCDQKFVEDVPYDLHGFIEEFKKSDKKGITYTISPIHFRDRSYGYCLIGDSEFPFRNPLFYTWLLTIGNTIETIRKQTLMKEMIKKLDSVWSFDSLTEIYNRSGFQKYGTKVWEDGMYNRKSGVMMAFMDLDGLKSVNDTYGHEEGDSFIRSFASIIREQVHHGEAAMRYGGDEFVIISPNGNDIFAGQYVEELKKKIEIFNQKNEIPYRLDASIGYYIVSPGDSITLDEAIEKADVMMYENKKKKKRSLKSK